MRNDSDSPSTVALPGPTTVGPMAAERVTKFVLAAVGIASLILFPTLSPNAFILSIGVTVVVYAVYATSWNFVGGLIGYVSLGQAAWAGLGGYATATLVVDAGVNPWLALALGTAIVTVLAVPIGIASLRVRGASFVIVSIALVLILQLVAQSWSSLTNGSSGIRVPRPFASDVLRPEQHERFFYIFGALLVVLLVIWWAIDRSRFGIGLKAIREDEDKAQSLGIPTFRYKLIVFVLSSATTAIGGGLYALWFGFLDPIFQFSILVGANIVLMALLGGVRSLVGPAIGAIIVGCGLEFIKTHWGDTQFHLIALGLLLAVVVLFMPDGIVPAVVGLVRRFQPAGASIREETQADLRQRTATGPSDELDDDRVRPADATEVDRGQTPTDELREVPR